MNTNKIVVNGKEFSDATHWNNDPGMTVFSCNLFASNSLLGDELSVDTLETQLNCSSYGYTYFRPKDSSCYVTRDNELFCVRPRVVILAVDPTQYTYGQKVQYYRDSTLIATLYMSSVTRVGKYIFAISCTSAIGLLDNDLHYGGIYSGESMSTVLADIMGNSVDYSLDSSLSTMRVYGWLPVATRRENLQQLLFAEGGAARSQPNGSIQIQAIQAQNIKTISDSRLYSGGNVEYRGGITSVSVTEHSYWAFDTDPETRLFEGNVVVESLTTPKGQTVQGVLVTFKEPMHNLKATGAKIIESGANYAVLGSGLSCVLTGKAYTHTARVVVRPDQNATRALSAAEDNTAIVTDATLVSLVNVESVAERIYSYYRAPRTICNEIVLQDEKPGDYVSLNDAFDDFAQGFITSLDVNVSQTLKANAQVLAGYEPPLPGDYYSHIKIITSNQTWRVPKDCRGKIRVVLGGGGQGGYSGCKGGDGEVIDKISGPAGSYFNPGTPDGYGLGIAGAGGAGGQGGIGGKVLQLTISVSVGQTFVVTIGKGGEGGKYSDGENSPGSMGTASTFGSYSSDSGEVAAVGYVEQFNGEIYSAPGDTGIAGGSGAGWKVEAEGPTWENCYRFEQGSLVYDEDGRRWYPGTTYFFEGGTSDNNGQDSINRVSKQLSFGDLMGGYVTILASDAPGGGAAAGQHGPEGSSGEAYIEWEYDQLSSYQVWGLTRSGATRNGANATKTPAKAKARGKGGRGGYGGGGAAGHGMSCSVIKEGPLVGYASVDHEGAPGEPAGQLGTGGTGGDGGAGGDGYVIIYW